MSTGLRMPRGTLHLARSMRFDPRHRLSRPIPGEHVGEYLSAPESSTERAWERDRALDRPCPVPARDSGDVRQVKVKMTTRVAETRPNAPLLIRLVRHPYALDLGRAKKVAYLSQDANVAPRERVDWHGEVQAALADRPRLRSTSVEPRPMPFTIRPSTWTLLPDADPA